MSTEENSKSFEQAVERFGAVRSGDGSLPWCYPRMNR